MGVLVAAVQRGDSLLGPLALTGVVFVLLQVLAPDPDAVSHNLGDRTAAWLYDRLTARLRAPARHGAPRGSAPHRRPHRRARLRPRHDRAAAVLRAGLHRRRTGGDDRRASRAAAVLFGYAWWAPIVLAGAWLATHWLLRESAIWHDRNTDEVRSAQRDADYAYRLAVDPPASKELRLFGLVGWTIDRFIARRTRLHRAPVPRDPPARAPAALEPAAGHSAPTSSSSGRWRAPRAAGSLDLGGLVVYAQCAVGTSLIAFGGLNWAMDGAAAPVAAVLRLEPAMAPAGALPSGRRPAARACPRARSASAT